MSFIQMGNNQAGLHLIGMSSPEDKKHIVPGV
jgi:hypothetical protein